jgi:hypothetical protein
VILTFVALFLCCSAKSGGEVSHNAPVKAGGSLVVGQFDERWWADGDEITNS